MPVLNTEIAEIFTRIADLLEIEGANTFRIRAYRDAARTIEGYPRQIQKMITAGESIDDIPGIGEDLAQKINEIVETGELAFFENLRSRTPESLLKLLKISGLGPKRVKQIYEELHITDLEELHTAVQSGQLEALDGFGPKTVENIRNAFADESFSEARIRLDTAEKFAGPLEQYLLNVKGVENVIVAGSYRRRKPTVGDLDIIVMSESGEAASKALIHYDSVVETISRGEKKTSVRLRSGLQVDLRIVSEECFGATMLYFTGAKAHNIHLRRIAKDKKLKINEYGVYKGDKRLVGKTEKEIYKYFGMDWIEPELRQDTGEIEAALEGSLPELVTLDNIRGDLQMHSDHSDGKNSIVEMAFASERLGYDYIAITDHTSYIGVTQGLDMDDIGSYIEEIDTFNDTHDRPLILKGVEVDIPEDGSLDLPDAALEKMDIVLGSIHSHFDLSKQRQTQRLLRALDHPSVNILAHPTTRKIGKREAIELSMETIMEAAVERGCFLEINANPERLDIWDQYIRLAGDIGLKLSISTDAHHQSALKNMKYGIDQARRGWAKPVQIINSYPLEKLKPLLRRE